MEYLASTLHQTEMTPVRSLLVNDIHDAKNKGHSMKTTRIRHYFETLKDAEQHQDELYDRYTNVRLIQAPLFMEDGYYHWEVSD